MTVGENGGGGGGGLLDVARGASGAALGGGNAVSPISSPAPSALTGAPTPQGGGGGGGGAAGTPRIVLLSRWNLYFPPPLNTLITNNVSVQNTSPTCIVWKLKCKNPFRYDVSPDRGFLLPLTSCDVKITYKPRKEEQGGKENPEDLTGEMFQLEAKIAALTDEKRVTELFKEKDGTRVRYRIPCIFGPKKSKTPSRAPSLIRDSTSPAPPPPSASAVTTALASAAASAAGTPLPADAAAAAAAAVSGYRGRSGGDYALATTPVAGGGGNGGGGGGGGDRQERLYALRREQVALAQEKSRLGKQVEDEKREQALLKNDLSGAGARGGGGGAAGAGGGSSAAGGGAAAATLGVPLHLAVGLLLFAFFAARVVINMADEVLGLC